MEAQKQKYIDDMQAQLQRLQGRLNEIEAGIAKAGERVQDEYNQHARVLETKMNAARTKLEQLRESGADEWSNHKKQTEQAWDDLNNAFSVATTALSK